MILKSLTRFVLAYNCLYNYKKYFDNFHFWLNLHNIIALFCLLKCFFCHTATVTFVRIFVLKRMNKKNRTVTTYKGLPQLLVRLIVTLFCEPFAVMAKKLF